MRITLKQILDKHRSSKDWVIDMMLWCFKNQWRQTHLSFCSMWFICFQNSQLPQSLKKMTSLTHLSQHPVDGQRYWRVATYRAHCHAYYQRETSLFWYQYHFSDIDINTYYPVQWWSSLVITYQFYVFCCQGTLQAWLRPSILWHKFV